MVFGEGPDCGGPPPLVVMGVAVPRSAASEVLTSGTFWTSSSAPPRTGEVLWDDTLVSSMAVGDGACDGPSLSASSGAREFLDDVEVFGISRGGLKCKQRYNLYNGGG